ncbi:MAG: hypothetical protein KJ737_20750 [Proteobacteria bacterium]|nr:hypothetical protein [Pseudomonadota bacterium]
MKRSIFNTRFLSGAIGLCIVISIGCGEDKNVVEEKSKTAMSESKYANVYDILEDYPGLETFFTSSDLTIPEFENKLFGDFLGNDSTANVIANLSDILPPLIDTGFSFPLKTFSIEAQASMKSKGPVPDLMATLGEFTSNIIAVDDEKKAPFYNYLEDLDDLENSHPDSPETTDYLVAILRKVVGYLSSMAKDDVNLRMDFLVDDLQEFIRPEDGELDFEDVDALLEKFARKSPEGCAKIIQALKSMFYDDEEVKSALKGMLNSLGNFSGDKDVYITLKTMLQNIYDTYNEDRLGEIFDHLWAKGPWVGPVVSEIGFDTFGKDGKQEYAIRDLLMHANLVNILLETIHNFEKDGYSMDHVDDHFITMATSDAFCFDRSGLGEYGDGRFYEPNGKVSYKDFSALRALAAYLTRWNVPLTFTANFLFEGENAEKSAGYMRKMIPTADQITITHSLWAEKYEKGEGYYMGHGHPITEKRGYGKMVDGVYVAPLCPAVVGAADMALFLVADGLYNGPYDNIYDNMRWVLFERKYYATMDLVQLAPRIPSMAALIPFFNMMRIKTLPITFMVNVGATSTIYIDLDTIVKNLPEALSNAAVTYNLPQWVTDMAAESIKAYMPCGYPEEGTDKIYFLPRDLRDMWVLVMSLAYWDSDAFHLDRFLDTDHPENYKYYYDLRDYTYKKNKEKINPMFNFVAALGMASYLAYQDVVSPYPLSLDGLEPRLAAAKKAFGVTYPFGYILNLFSPLAEVTTETGIYDNPATESMPLGRFLEPLAALESKGLIKNLLHVASVLGKPELADARGKIAEGLAEVVGTVEKDTTSPYTLARELLTITEKATDDERRWDSMKLTMDTIGGIFSEDSSYQVVDDLLGFIDHVTSVDISDTDWAKASQGIVEVMGNSSEDRVLTRGLIHATTILKEVNKTHIWADALKTAEEALQPDGVLSYVLCGLERDPSYSFEEILIDTDRFFHSDTMMNYEEGSFWKDIYHLLDFMAGALTVEEVEE